LRSERRKACQVDLSQSATARKSRPWVAGGARVKFSLFGGEGVAWVYPPQNGQQIAAMLVVPLAEEPGWRGFALPRLLERHGPLRASLVLGIVWALWHTLMFLLQGVESSALFALSMLNILLGSFVFSWLYQRTRGALMIAIVAHAGAHLCNPSHALPASSMPLVLYTAGIGVLAAALVFVDRAVWRERFVQVSGA
jgi:membrane protease YdiL (CAAX protease family)